MSASMVRHSLNIVDPVFTPTGNPGKKSNKVLIPENQKLFKTIRKKGKKYKVNVLQSSSKLTVTDFRKNKKSKEEVLQKNLETLKSIKQACAIDLDEEIANQLIERAVTKRPINLHKKEKAHKTAFTEDDFQKFEEEYFPEDEH